MRAELCHRRCEKLGEIGWWWEAYTDRHISRAFPTEKEARNHFAKWQKTVAKIELKMEDLS